MLKLKINLFIAEDGFENPYPVTMLDGNIKPEIPNSLPFCEDERVNFQYQYAPTYADISNNKVNTRFLYPYSRAYKEAGTEGRIAAYADLNIFQRLKLSFITKTSVIHKHPFQFIFIILNTLGFIPLWIPFLFPGNPENIQFPNHEKPQEIRNNKVDSIHSPYQTTDTLK